MYIYGLLSYGLAQLMIAYFQSCDNFPWCKDAWKIRVIVGASRVHNLSEIWMVYCQDHLLYLVVT